MSKQRNRRISEEIKKVVSNLIMFGIKDPRISKLTSVTFVETTNDLRYTNIFISVYDPKADPAKTLEGLNSAKGLIRKEISKELNLRVTPEPLFTLDTSISNGMHINSLLKSVGADELLRRDTIEDNLDEDDFEDEDDDFEDEDDDFEDDSDDDEFDEDEDEDDYEDEDEDDYEDDDEEEIDEEESTLKGPKN